MENDPIYLSQALTCEASLGVLSVAGNVCRMSLSEKLGYVKFWLALVLECFEGFTGLCEVKERFESIDEVLREVKKE